MMERLGDSGIGTPHRMRAAFSTHFNPEGASVDVIEHCLAHVPAHRVRATYNRHQYQDERRNMFHADTYGRQLWRELNIVATILEPPVAEKILVCFGEGTRVSPRTPARDWTL